MTLTACAGSEAQATAPQPTAAPTTAPTPTTAPAPTAAPTAVPTLAKGVLVAGVDVGGMGFSLCIGLWGLRQAGGNKQRERREGDHRCDT